ncbi:AsmA family protein [Magnetospirillum sp. UT-4]|uniref:AsmA family protein n=1 Tax=Magnetospirillum sp. UT-4 TaxID=2681467 RepID=UPI001384DE67|nr:AsmA family protein [Magnetospirillum sp. UT-4]CAA7626949.1 conserved exported hypothetical protein [Magnetospirillum sp. UT-4]
MKTWAKITIGVAVAAVAALAVGPALIGAERWRGTVAARLSEATGRDVAIAGPMSLRLIPSPALSAEDIRIASPAGAEGPPLAEIGRLRVSVRLLPLLAGRVEVSALTLDRPRINLVRYKDGSANWQLGGQAAEEPAAEAGRRRLQTEPSPPAEAGRELSINDLVIHDGTVTYGDAKAPTVTVEAVAARIAIGGLAGPFSGEGSARVQGHPIGFRADLDRVAAGRGSPAALRVTLPDSDASLAFSGLLSRLSGGETLRGRLSAEAPDLGAALGRFGIAAPLPAATPFKAEAELSLAAEELAATDLVLNLGSARATGAVTAALNGTPRIDASLKAGAIDLDALMAAPPAPARPAPAAPSPPAQAPAQSAAPQAAAGGFSLPQDIFATLQAEVEALSWRGQVIRQARVQATLDSGEVVVQRASAQLPGGTALAAEGTVMARQGRPAFDGSLELGSDNPSALLAWAGAGGDLLAGRPGRLTLASPVKVDWPNLALPGFRAALGKDSARGALALALGTPLAVDLDATVEGVGPLALKGTVASGAVDLAARAFGASATIQGTLGASTALAVAARHPDLLQALRRFAPDYRPRGPLGAFDLAATVTGGGNAYDVSGLTVSAGSNRLAGEARVETAGPRPRVIARLSGESIDLDPFLAPRRTGRAAPGGPRLPPVDVLPAPPPLPAAASPAGAAPWSREPLDLAALRGFDAQLMLEARSLAGGGWRLDTPKANATLADGVLALDSLTGTLMGGALTASGRLNAAAASPGLSGQFAIAGAEIGALGLGAGAIKVSRGRMEAQGRFAASGRSTQDMASSLSGDGRLLVRDGTIDGFDLPAVSRQLKTIETIGSLLGLAQSGLSGGSTRFSSLAGTFRAENGVVTTRDLRLDAEGGGATAVSTTDLGRWTTATEIAFALADSTAPPLLVRLEGPIGNPRKVVDVNALQQHLVARGLGRALKGKGGGIVEGLLGIQRGDGQRGDGQRGDGQRGEPQQGTEQQGQAEEKPSGKRVLQDLLKGFGGR